MSAILMKLDNTPLYEQFSCGIFVRFDRTEVAWVDYSAPGVIKVIGTSRNSKNILFTPLRKSLYRLCQL